MVYYVEDDSSIRELVIYTLRNTGFEAEGFSDGEVFFSALREKKPELVILDIMLPGEDGISILRRLRSSPETSNVPVILLTAKDAEYEKVTGLDAGADDYISKPFGMMELLARVRAVLRRAERPDKGYLSAGAVCVDERAHTVTVNGSEIRLTLKEYQLLCLLMQNRGAALTRDAILENVWGYNDETRTVDVHIRTLRQKLGDAGSIIETVRGVGYRMRDSET